MDHATNFALDVQGAIQNGTMTPLLMREIADKYGGTRRDDNITLDFSDGSVARWSVEHSAFELNPRS
jgi:hypothetical protein